MALSVSASRRAARLGSSRLWTCMAAATCMAVGKVSLDDWLMLTWSLGCTGVLLPSCPPSSSIARLEMTSFTFILVCVPEPVCHTTRGK